MTGPGGATWDLDEQQLLAAATLETGGLSDLGPPEVWRGVRRLVRLAEIGAIDAIRTTDPRSDAERTLVDLLARRLEFVADEARYPAILDERIDAPLIVMGLARSGLSALHALLASDPQHRAPRYWELRQCSPPPSLPRADDAPIAEATTRLRPLAAFFDEGGMTTAECEWVWETEAFLGGFLSDDDAEQYAFHRRFLQHLQFAGPDRRWVLKGTRHQYRLASLLAEYPDATLVWVHRDPGAALAEAIAEQVAFQVAHRGGSGAVPADEMRQVGQRTLATLRQLVARSLTSEHLGSVHHILHRDLISDPEGTVRAVYAAAHLPFSPAGLAALRHHIETHPFERSAPAGHSIDSFGFDVNELNRSFAEYRRRFAIPLESD